MAETTTETLNAALDAYGSLPAAFKSFREDTITREEAIQQAQTAAEGILALDRDTAVDILVSEGLFDSKEAAGTAFDELVADATAIKEETLISRMQSIVLDSNIADFNNTAPEQDPFAEPTTEPVEEPQTTTEPNPQTAYDETMVDNQETTPTPVEETVEATTTEPTAETTATELGTGAVTEPVAEEQPLTSPKVNPIELEEGDVDIAGVLAQQQKFIEAQEALTEKEGEDTSELSEQQMREREEALAEMRRQRDSAEFDLFALLETMLSGLVDSGKISSNGVEGSIRDGIISDNALELSDILKGTPELESYQVLDGLKLAGGRTENDFQYGANDRTYNAEYGYNNRTAITDDIDYEESLENQIEAFREKAEQIRDRGRALSEDGNVGFSFEQSAQRWEVRAARLEDQLVDFRNKDAEGALKELGRVEEGMDRATSRMASVQTGIDAIQRGEGDGVALAEQMTNMQMDLSAAKVILERQRDDIENRNGYEDPELVSRLERMERRVERMQMKGEEIPVGLQASIEATREKIGASVEQNRLMDVDGRSSEATRAISEIDKALERIEAAQSTIEEITQDGTVNRIKDKDQLEALEQSFAAIRESQERIEQLQQGLNQEIAGRGERNNEQVAMNDLRETGRQKQEAWDAAWEAKQPQSFADMDPTLRNAIIHRGNPNNEYAGQLERERNEAEVNEILGSFARIDSRTEDVGNNTDNLNPGGRGAGGEIEIT